MKLITSYYFSLTRDCYFSASCSSLHVFLLLAFPGVARWGKFTCRGLHCIGVLREVLFRSGWKTKALRCPFLFLFGCNIRTLWDWYRLVPILSTIEYFQHCHGSYGSSSSSLSLSLSLAVCGPTCEALEASSLVKRRMTGLRALQKLPNQHLFVFLFLKCSKHHLASSTVLVLDLVYMVYIVLL